MLTYSETKEIIKDAGRDRLEKLLRDYGEEVLRAALECGVQMENIEEAYCGEFGSDEEFTKDLIAGLGELPALPTYIHINWERTARDIMMDYSEHDGHYFRDL